MPFSTFLEKCVFGVTPYDECHTAVSAAETEDDETGDAAAQSDRLTREDDADANNTNRLGMAGAYPSTIYVMSALINHHFKLIVVYASTLKLMKLKFRLVNV